MQVFKLLSHVSSWGSLIGCVVEHIPTWVISVIGHERSVLDCFRKCVIMRELCDGQPFHPIVLLVVTIQSQELFKNGVNSFRLSVCLGVSSRAQFPLDMQRL